MTGWVCCDDIETVYDDEVRADAGAVTAPTMRRVEEGLRAAFGIQAEADLPGPAHATANSQVTGWIYVS
jgi:hypothetical protein